MFPRSLRAEDNTDEKDGSRYDMEHITQIFSPMAHKLIMYLDCLMNIMII